MAYNAAKPADTQFISAGPADIRANQEALRTGQVVDALKLKGYSPGNASGNVPVSNGTLCTNLNADKLDGNEATAFATAGHTHPAATTSSNGLMSNTDKAKLDGIASGAQPNQSAFANIVVDGTTLQSDNASDTFTMVSGANITLTPDAANDKVTMAVTGAIPVANGGTGATTAAAALANLGVTATAAELNHLDGITSTVAELNFVDGVTSNVQTQLNAKAPTSHAVAASTYGLGTASVYGHAAASSATPLVAGTAAVGTDNGKYARENHVHPLQTSVSGASGSCTGNAATATKLATARTISLTGAVTGSVTFDGSTNASILTSAGTITAQISKLAGKTSPTLTPIVDWTGMAAACGVSSVKNLVNSGSGITAYGGDSSPLGKGDVWLTQPYTAFDEILVVFCEDSCAFLGMKRWKVWELQKLFSLTYHFNLFDTSSGDMTRWEIWCSNKGLESHLLSTTTRWYCAVQNSGIIEIYGITY